MLRFEGSADLLGVGRRRLALIEQGRQLAAVRQLSCLGRGWVRHDVLRDVAISTDLPGTREELIERGERLGVRCVRRDPLYRAHALLEVSDAAGRQGGSQALERKRGLDA